MAKNKESEIVEIGNYLVHFISKHLDDIEDRAKKNELTLDDFIFVHALKTIYDKPKSGSKKANKNQKEKN